MKPSEQSRIFELMMAMDQVRRVWKNVDPGTDINKSQFFTLMLLRNKGQAEHGNPDFVPKDPYSPMTLSALAKAMGQTMPAISQRISQLEAMGYVQRKQDEQDRRCVWISLTSEGNRAAEDARNTMLCRMARVISVMESTYPDSVQNLIESCYCLVDAMETEFARPHE